MLECGKSIHDVFMEFSDILTVIIPEIEPCINAPHNNKWHKHDIFEHILFVVDTCKTTKFEIKLAALLHDIGKPACRIHDVDCDHFNGHPQVSVDLARHVFAHDLVLSTREKELVLGLIDKHDIQINPEHKAIKRFLASTSEDFVRDWLILKEADLMDHQAAPGKEDKWNDTLNRFGLFKTNLELVVAENNALKVTDLAVNGKDIIDLLKIKSGPVIGKVLNGLFEAVLDEKVPNDRDALLELAKTLA